MACGCKSGCGCGSKHGHDDGCGCGSKHNHSDGCGCGSKHEHGDDCGCGSEHQHEHNTGNSCGENCECGSKNEIGLKFDSTELSIKELSFIKLLDRHLYLPLVQFIIKGDNHFESIALSNVFIQSPHQTINQTKDTGSMLKGLEEKGIITLDYDIPLDGCDYSDYKNSDIYQEFCGVVDEGKSNPNFLGKEAVLECGSIALTPVGEQLVQQN